MQLLFHNIWNFYFIIYETSFSYIMEQIGIEDKKDSNREIIEPVFWCVILDRLIRF